MKVIKDHHKSKIVNLKFCELTGKKVEEEKQTPTTNSTTSRFNKFKNDLFKKDPKKEQAKKEEKKESEKNEDKQNWMFLSIDEEGRVIVNTVEKVVIIYKTAKYIIVDPHKNNGPI